MGSGLTPLLIKTGISAPLPAPDVGDPIIQSAVTPQALQPWVDMRSWLQNNQEKPNATTGIWDPNQAFNWSIKLDPILDGSSFAIPNSISGPWQLRNAVDGYTFNIMIISSSTSIVNITWTADWKLPTSVASTFLTTLPASSRSIISCLVSSNSVGITSATYPIILCSTPTIYGSM